MTMDGADRAVGAWRSQPPGAGQMNSTDIRVKAELLAARTATQMRLGGLALGVVAIGNVVEVVLESNDLERLGSGLTILAVAFVTFDYWRRKRRDLAACRSAGVDSLRFYRAELMRQRAEIGQFWWRWVLPFVPGIALSVFGRSIVTPRSLSQSAVLAVLVAILLGGITLANRREARRIQKEFDELDS